MMPQVGKKKKNQGNQDHPESSKVDIKRTKFLAAQKQSQRMVPNKGAPAAQTVISFIMATTLTPKINK